MSYQQYKLIPTSGKSVPTLEKTLNKMAGEQGWEVATSYPMDGGAVLVMERTVSARPDTSFYDGLNKLKETR